LMKKKKISLPAKNSNRNNKAKKVSLFLFMEHHFLNPQFVERR
jgi:hypothetical protein